MSRSRSDCQTQLDTAGRVHIQQADRSSPYRRLPENLAFSLLEMILPLINPGME
jgi:hypothetical protein